MSAYATYQDIEKRLNRTFSESEIELCEALLNDASIYIDAYNDDANENIKKVVSCNMVVRAMGTMDTDIPIGATQTAMSALGYSQSWTMGSSGSVGELYLTKSDKKLLGVGNKIGSYSPLEGMIVND